MNNTFNALCKAVDRYIVAHGGSTVVIGGIGISKRGKLKGNYTLHIDFLGNPPKTTKK